MEERKPKPKPVQPPCPRPGCRRNMKRGHAFCTPCWFSLPQTLRTNIWRTFQAKCNAASKAKSNVTNSRSFAACREDHAAAMQAALDYFAQEGVQS